MRPILCSLVSLFFLAAPVQAAEDKKLSWLFVMTGQLESISETELIINAHPTVLAFSDLPNREVKSIGLESFIDVEWMTGPDSFASNPPNAAVVFGEAQIGIDELKSVQRSGSKISFTTQNLKGNLPLPGDHIALVIDIF